MNFEELYNKYKNGTATEEERQYVEDEIAKARALSSILDEADARRVIAPTDGDKIKKARRSFGRRLAVKIVCISLACLAVASIAVTGTVFGIALHSASSLAEYDRFDAEELAKKCVIDHIDGIAGKCAVSEVERDLRFGAKLRESYYLYEIDVICGDEKYEVEVNSVTGAARITDVD